jgi:hypothetical protein
METKPIRIERIRVNKGGPLKNDFELEPGAINLIHGHNETGKSYVVEAIINTLFRTGKKAPIGWKLRGLSSAGNITVSGLNDRPVTFKKTSDKLEDYWEEETGLPQDLSRMLVVKEGETLLAEGKDVKDGVGRDILKNYLSGVGLLDTIEDRISATLRGAEVKDKAISGNQAGEIGKRTVAENSRLNLTKLFEEVEDAYTSGIIHDLRQQQTDIQNKIDGLEKAKRYHAYCLQTEIDSLNREKARLPSEKDLIDIEKAIAVYETKEGESKRISTEIASLESDVDNYHWAEKALKNYEEIMGKQGAKPKVVYAVLTLFFFAGVVVSGLLNFPIPLAICAAGTLVFSALYASGMRRSPALAGVNQELENLKKGFEKRFGSELTDKAVLEAKLAALGKTHAKYEVLADNSNKLKADLESQKNSITEKLREFTGKVLPPKDWRSAIDNLKQELDELTDKISSLNDELIPLNIPAAEFLLKAPGEKWDAERYKDLEGELSEITKTLTEELAKLNILQARIAQETGLKNTDWEELITALRDKREEVAQEYREVTADILAKILVYSVIQKLREKENARIAAGLERKELTDPLHAITGCYKCMRYDEKDGLFVVNDKDEEYPLNKLSTGAKEQAFLAMRMGFASIAMKGRTAFLILDDAFQHSDWPRRTKLMSQVQRLVGSHWQIFYFTMDDHIRDLFMKEGEKLGDRFKSLELI